MSDFGHEACRRKLKSKPCPTLSFFRKKGKEVWCLVCDASWFLLGKHATCWSSQGLDADATWLKDKSKKPKYSVKISGRSLVLRLENKKYVRSQSVHLGSCGSPQTANSNARDWERMNGKQCKPSNSRNGKTYYTSSPSWQNLIASSVHFLQIFRKGCQKNSKGQMCFCCLKSIQWPALKNRGCADKLQISSTWILNEKLKYGKRQMTKKCRKILSRFILKLYAR